MTDTTTKSASATDSADSSAPLAGSTLSALGIKVTATVDMPPPSTAQFTHHNGNNAKTTPSSSPSSTSTSKELITVCVIGSGPGGMFFCYHMDQTMRQAAAGNDNTTNDNNDNTPFNIQCFEKASSPGGVWRKADSKDTSDAVEMYDNLWTNGASHNMEFYDYTFDQHFERPVSVYLKRQEVLGYMKSRVTRNCPNFFDKYVQFNTEVTHVQWKHELNKFIVQTKNNTTQQTTVQEFDFCIWAAGANGKQKLPKATVHKLKSGSFAGPILHSADSADLERVVKDKRILLVGGSYSAEDLAIQSVKLGVKHVDIVARSGESNVYWVGNWPGNKVDIHLGYQILKAEGDSTIHLEQVVWEWPDKYDGVGTIEKTLENIDAVLFCTGYGAAYQMMDPKLLFRYSGVPLQIPEGWKMTENIFTKHLGDVKPSATCRYGSGLCPDLYHGVMIDNPRMMYFQDLTSSPMMDHDAFAYLFAGHISGSLKLPDEAAMRKYNQYRALTEMNITTYRLYMDIEYDYVIGNVPGLFASDGTITDAWSSELSKGTPYTVQLLAGIMQAGNYPMSLGTYEELNEAGKRIVLHDVLTDWHRSLATEEENKSEDRRRWTTFRDYQDGEKFESIHTGSKAVNLEMTWIQM